MSILALNTKIVVKPDVVSPFLQALKKTARHSIAEPGCLQFVIGRQADPVAENVFFVHDQFRDVNAYEKHEDMPYFRDFLDQVGPLLSEPPLSRKYLCPHDPVKRKPTTGYCLNVESIVKPDLVDEYNELIQSHSANSRLEPACVQFDWGKTEPNNDGHVCFYFHEEYVDRAGFEAHTVTPHFKRFVEFNQVKQPYITPQVVDFFEIVDYTADDSANE